MINDAAHLLTGIDIITESSQVKDIEAAKLILEDNNSPVSRKFHENLYKSIIEKAHIDFGDIPNSKGNIRNYKGYPSMVQTLEAIEGLAKEDKNKEVLEYVLIVKTAIDNIANLSSTYEKGFTTKATMVALEYDTYVYTCVQATSALLYTFIDYVKHPTDQVMKVELKNTKLRADAFYFDQLSKYNNVQEKMGISYRKYLEEICNKGQENFLGAETLVGVATISVIALAIVPVTRELIYQIYRLRSNLSEALEMQANFLEMNQTSLENNSTLDVKKRTKVIEKQKKLANALHKIGDKIRVKSAKSISEAKKDLDKDKNNFALNNIRDDVSDSFELV
jgi:hypothetical protein